MCLHSIQTVPHVCILPVASDSMTTEESEGGAHVNCARHRSQVYKSGGVLIGDIMFIQHISRNAFVPHLCRREVEGVPFEEIVLFQNNFKFLKVRKNHRFLKRVGVCVCVWGGGGGGCRGVRI